MPRAPHTLSGFASALSRGVRFKLQLQPPGADRGQQLQPACSCEQLSTRSRGFHCLYPVYPPPPSLPPTRQSAVLCVLCVSVPGAIPAGTIVVAHLCCPCAQLRPPHPHPCHLHKHVRTHTARALYCLFCPACGLLRVPLAFTFDYCISMVALAPLNAVQDSACGFVGVNALWFSGDGPRQLTTEVMHMPMDGKVSFVLRLGHDSSSSGCEEVDYGEGVVFEVRRLGDYHGAHVVQDWLVVWDSNTVLSYYKSAMRQVDVPIAVLLNFPASESFVQFRWRQVDHSGGSFDNWMVDEIQIDGIGVSVCVFP